MSKSHLRSVGQSYHHFTLNRLVDIPELQCTLRELSHEPTGAQIMHIENEDPENLFCLSFQTLPYNSNGVAHILEHTVLCGSEKFPVKDPFFAMNRRSLNTFMNALTGADFTCYPAATQITKDFYNLLEVYLDAVFYPILSKYSFLQEGHRLEFQDPLDSTSPLEYKGIVYNEMKGALSSSSSRLSEAIHTELFPDITYGFNAGGDPKEIPSLSFEELKQFHRHYYHPSRCLFFFYGNMPLEKHLDFIKEKVLDRAEKSSPLPPVPLQKRFLAPKRKKLSYPLAEGESLKEKALISFAWLTCPILEQQEVLALSILEIILMDNDASPLKQALLKSGLCKQATAFIDTDLSEIPWGLTLRGCEAQSADALEALIKETLQKLVHQGIPLRLIENAIHQLEFYRSEITGDGAPFGLSLFMRSALLKQHGADPTEGLKIHSLFKRLHEEVLKTPNYFGRLIQKHLLDNPHFVRIVMEADPKLAETEHREETEKLESIKSSLSGDQKKQIVEEAKVLADYQEKQKEENLDVLPKVTLSDIPVFARSFSLKEEKIENTTIFHHDVFTNEIAYADLIYELPSLTIEEIPFLRLFTTVLTQVASKERSYQETLDEIQGHTGGLQATISLNLQAHDSHLCKPTFHLKGKALYRKVPELFALMRDALESPDLNDANRLKEIILKQFTSIESRLTQSALKYAINLSASPLSSASFLANELYGLPYFWQLKKLAENFDAQKEEIISRLKAIKDKVTCLENPHLVISCSTPLFAQMKSHRFYGLLDLPANSSMPWQNNLPKPYLAPQGRLIASPVAFIGKVFSTVSYTHPHTPALSIAAHLFDNKTLHSKIREQGGAYGGGSVCNPLSGTFYFYSYRDPNILSSLQAFEEAVFQITKGAFSDADLEEAKYEMIQALDTPISPGSQAEAAYAWWKEGRSLELRQAFRDKLLKLSKEDVVQAVEEIIVPEMSKGAAVIFAGKKLLEKANKELEKLDQAALAIHSIDR